MANDLVPNQIQNFVHVGDLEPPHSWYWNWMRIHQFSEHQCIHSLFLSRNILCCCLHISIKKNQRPWLEFSAIFVPKKKKNSLQFHNFLYNEISFPYEILLLLLLSYILVSLLFFWFSALLGFLQHPSKSITVGRENEIRRLLNIISRLITKAHNTTQVRQLTEHDEAKMCNIFKSIPAIAPIYAITKNWRS